MNLVLHPGRFWKRIFCLGVVQIILTMSAASYLAADEAEIAKLSNGALKIVLTDSPSLPVKICNQEDCDRIGIPKGAQESIANGYSDASLEDLRKL